jgi:hypothetical protein
MPNISAGFRNSYIERRRFVITDMSEENQTDVFAGDLDPDQSTGPLMLVTDEGPDATGAGMVMYQRLPDGELNTVAVQDGEEVSML